MGIQEKSFFFFFGCFRWFVCNTGYLASHHFVGRDSTAYAKGVRVYQSLALVFFFIGEGECRRRNHVHAQCLSLLGVIRTDWEKTIGHRRPVFSRQERGQEREG